MQHQARSDAQVDNTTDLHSVRAASPPSSQAPGCSGSHVATLKLAKPSALQLSLRFAWPVDMRTAKLQLSRKARAISASFEKRGAGEPWPQDAQLPPLHPKVGGGWLRAGVPRPLLNLACVAGMYRMVIQFHPCGASAALRCTLGHHGHFCGWAA